MTKKEIVKKISEDIGLTQLKTKDIVQRTLDAIIQTLVSEGRIELRISAFLKSSSVPRARRAIHEPGTRFTSRRRTS